MTIIGRAVTSTTATTAPTTTTTTQAPAPGEEWGNWGIPLYASGITAAGDRLWASGLDDAQRIAVESTADGLRWDEVDLGPSNLDSAIGPSSTRAPARWIKA